MKHSNRTALQFILSWRLAFRLPKQAKCIPEDVTACFLHLLRSRSQSQTLVMYSGFPVGFTHSFYEFNVCGFIHQLKGQIPHAGHCCSEVSTC